MISTCNHFVLCRDSSYPLLTMSFIHDDGKVIFGTPIANVDYTFMQVVINHESHNNNNIIIIIIQFPLVLQLVPKVSLVPWFLWFP